MASSNTALKERFAAPSEIGLQEALRDKTVSSNDYEGDFEDLDAINAAVNELIRLEARGQRLNLSVEDTQTYDALEMLAERFRQFGLSNRFSNSIINAIEDCAKGNGITFARKNRTEILSARIELTDKEPKLTKGRNHFIAAFDGKVKLDAQFSTMETHFTSSGTKTTTTSMPDLDSMFTGKTKYLLFIYEGLEGEALDSPDNVSADLGAVAAGGALPAEVVQELQTAIENGTITTDQIELIQAVAELGRVMELSATPGAIENPMAAIERLKDTVAQTLQGSDIPPALADAAQKSIQTMEIIVSSPEFSALITQGAPIDIVAQNDNEPVAETPDTTDTMEVLEQAGLDDAMTITLTSEQQQVLQELIQQSDLPAMEKMEILQQVADGTIERTTFGKIETVAVESGEVLPEAVAATVAELKEIVSTQDLAHMTATQPIALSEPQREALEALIQQQDIPAAERDQILAQLEQGAINRETFAKIEQIVAEVPTPAIATTIAEIRDVVSVQDKILPVLAEQKIFLSEAQQQDLKQTIAKQDLPPHVAEALMEQVNSQSISVETIARLTVMDKTALPPVIEALQNDARQIIRGQQNLMDVPVAVPLTPVVKEAVIDAIQKMDIPARAKENFIAEVKNEAPSRALLNTVNVMASSNPALNAFRDQSAAHFTRENVVQLATKFEDHLKNLPSGTPPETKTFIKNIMTDLDAGRPISWVNQAQLAKIAPDLSIKVAGVQTFQTPVRNPVELIEQMKEAHRIMAKTSPFEAKPIEAIIKRMEANPKDSVRIFDEAIGALPTNSKVFQKLSDASDKVQATVFQPREGKRDNMIAALEVARLEVSKEKRQVFDKVIDDLKLGNSVDRKDLNAVAGASAKAQVALAEGMQPEKQTRTLIKTKCDECPRKGQCSGCDDFKPAASVQRLKRDKDGHIIVPRKDM